MSLDDFQLPAFLAGELYKDCLVDLAGKQINRELLKEKELIFLGSNHKNIVVIVNDEQALHLADKQLSFLTAILTACKIAVSDIALINFTANPGINYTQLLEQFKPRIVLCLGIELSALQFPLEFPYYQVQQYNHASYLNAPSLKVLAAEEEKRKFWPCLRKIFSI